MRLRAVHILLLLAAVAGLSGCGHKGRVIPAKKMIRIYTDMYLADQWIRDHVEARAAADTTLFFDPIFKRYGYTFEDYDASLNYYVDRPVEFAEILTAASDRMRARSEALLAEVAAIREREEELDSFRRLYHPSDFSEDSLRWAGAGILWPEKPVTAGADSLAVDSLAVDSVPSGSEKVRPDWVKPELEGLDTWEEIKPVDPLDRPRPTRIRVEEKEQEMEIID